MNDSNARTAAIELGDAVRRTASAAGLGVVVDCDRHWIEIELADQFGRAVPWEPYELEDANGALHRGRLDANGFARIAPLPAGSCNVSFPDLDRRSWKPAAG